MFINYNDFLTKILCLIDTIWTKNATLMLLSLYETKIHMLDNPKKKSKMWISIAEELKTLNVEVVKFTSINISLLIITKYILKIIE